MIILLLFAAIASLVSGIAGIRYYDQIINYMYDQRRDLWTEVGMPPGVWHTPTLPSGFVESSAQIFMFKLTFSTPECMYSDEGLKVLTKRYKANGIICSVATAIFFVLLCVAW